RQLGLPQLQVLDLTLDVDALASQALRLRAFILTRGRPGQVSRSGKRGSFSFRKYCMFRLDSSSFFVPSLNLLFAVLKSFLNGYASVSIGVRLLGFGSFYKEGHEEGRLPLTFTPRSGDNHPTRLSQTSQGPAGTGSADQD